MGETNENMDDNTIKIEFLKEKYNKIFSKEEFNFLISILPYQKLIEYIKKYQKEFSKEAMGFRLDRLPIKNLQEIFYKRACIKKDGKLLFFVEKITNELLKQIDDKISKRIGLPQVVRENINNQDMHYFYKLIQLLVETNFKENILVYFKSIEIELSNDQIKYLNKNLIQIVLEYSAEKENKLVDSYKKEIKKIKKELVDLHRESTQEVELYYKKDISEKEEVIKSLRQEIRDYKAEIVSVKSTIADIEKELMNEVDFLEKENERLQKEVERLTSYLENVKAENTTQQNRITELSFLLKGECDELNNLVSDNWAKENQHLIDERNEIQCEIEINTQERNTIAAEVVSLNDRKKYLENRMEIVEHNSSNFIENIREIISDIGLKPNVTANAPGIYKIESSQLDNNLEVIASKKCFIEDLQENLEINGISNEYSLDLSQYIFATFSNKMALLLVGYNARKLADAISSIICGYSADVITLPMGFNDCKQLITAIDQTQSKVVLIENAIDNISESIYLPSIKQNRDKFLVFSIESSDNIDIIPTSILNYMMLVDIDTILGHERNEELLTGVVDKKIFDIEIDIASKNTNLRHLQRLDKAIKLCNITKYKKAEIMSIIDKLKSENALYDILLFSINILCKCEDKAVELIKFIEHQEFNPHSRKTLLSTIGDKFSE